MVKPNEKNAALQDVHRSWTVLLNANKNVIIENVIGYRR